MDSKAFHKKRASGDLKVTQSSFTRSKSNGMFSMQSSRQSVKVAEQVKSLSTWLEHKLSIDFTSVRKAFLAIDDKHLGYITAESLARYLGASKQKNFDFTLLEILVKMHTTKAN